MNFPGGKMNFKTILALAIITSSFSITQAADLIYKGATPKISSNTDKNFNKNMPSFGREEINYYLRAEAGVRTVNEAINLKTQGLRYVRDIFDFEYLTSCPFANPSDAYKVAVGDFIANYVGNYVYSTYDLNMLRVLESRVPNVNQAIAVKSAGLKIHMQISDYLQLIPPSVGNPSDAYKTAISNFTAKNISYVLDNYSPIYLIIEAEKFTTIVSDAMMVKNAGLVAVHSRQDLFELAAYSVPNPSPAYQRAVNDFIRNNLNRYPY